MLECGACCEKLAYFLPCQLIIVCKPLLFIERRRTCCVYFAFEHILLLCVDLVGIRERYFQTVSENLVCAKEPVQKNLFGVFTLFLFLFHQSYGTLHFLTSVLFSPHMPSNSFKNSPLREISRVIELYLPSLFSDSSPPPPPTPTPFRYIPSVYVCLAFQHKTSPGDMQ